MYIFLLPCGVQVSQWYLYINPNGLKCPCLVLHILCDWVLLMIFKLLLLKA